MSDWKSKLPSLKEVASMTMKLATDIKTSVTQIARDYKENHPTVPDSEPKSAEPAKPAEAGKPVEPEKKEPVKKASDTKKD